MPIISFLITVLIIPMATKLDLFSILLLLSFTLTCGATNYMVGDTSGWDISTDLDTWTQNKIFNVGDVLVFQYSSSESVDEVNKEAYNNCNTSNVIQTYRNGNTTVTLSRPGPWYFISGNRLYCLGGMKLQVNVQGTQANSPIGTPEAQPGAPTDLPKPSSKNNNPVPSSSGFTYSGKNYLLNVFVGFVSTALWLLS